MIRVKSNIEIKKMLLGGKLLSKALKGAADAVRPGIAIKELDRIAEKIIRDGGGEPSFKGYKNNQDDIPFPSTLCVSVNEEIVHGLGNRSRKLKDGEIVGLDIGCWYDGLCTDMAVTVPVGRISSEAKSLIKMTKKSLFKGIEAAMIGNSVKDISIAVEKTVQPYGYGIVRALVGHGVGYAVHEEPAIPNFFDPHSPDIKLIEGLCIAIEPMISLGDCGVTTSKDGWAVIMSDKSFSAHFEVTLAITKKGPQILTPLPI